MSPSGGVAPVASTFTQISLDGSKVDGKMYEIPESMKAVSMPDDELLSLADKGMLSQPEVLRGQVDRLLHDAKGDRFVKNFTGQWLNIAGSCIENHFDLEAPDCWQVQ